MPPEMFIGLSLSGLLILMSGKSPAKTDKSDQKTVVTFILPDCNDGGTLVGKTQAATFEQR